MLGNEETRIIWKNGEKGELREYCEEKGGSAICSVPPPELVSFAIYAQFTVSQSVVYRWFAKWIGDPLVAHLLDTQDLGICIDSATTGGPWLCIVESPEGPLVRFSKSQLSTFIYFDMAGYASGS
ncbi:hypothetical protein HAX54_016033, partial [Datura stramonium]|nr:hypothetical protein [Datura stramonium]